MATKWTATRATRATNRKATETRSPVLLLLMLMLLRCQGSSNIRGKQQHQSSSSSSSHDLANALANIIVLTI